MRIFKIIFLVFLISIGELRAQVAGTVLAEGEVFPGATIQLIGGNEGTVSDANGYFELNDIPDGTHQVEIRSVGFKNVRKEILIPGTYNFKIELEESMLAMDEVVVTGTMQPTFVTASPVKVEVVTADYINTYSPAAATSIVEGISLVNGVQEVVACGVCFTNSISINGLPGPYTAILMDGSPIYGNLASVYGLNGIPSMIIDRFEVIKGPSSTLYGSEAVAGVINIITKDPSKQPKLSIDLMGTTNLETFGNLAIAPKIGGSNGFVGINFAHMDGFDDINDDGFSDRINLERVSIFSKWDINRPSGLKWTISGKFFYEDRRNGVEEFLEGNNYRILRGSEEIYGESIYTNRFELFGTYQISKALKIDYSVSTHNQNSYYGSDFYTADQQIFFTNFIWNQKFNSHSLTLGGTNRYQQYDDNTVATETSNQNQPDNQFIPGFFAQDEWEISTKLTSLSGIRIDHYEDHGIILSPRLSLKYQLGNWTSLRSNFGTGFRIVNLFTEDHAFVTGQREVIITEELNPEESYNLSFDLNHVYTIGLSQGMIDVDAYYTHFTNKITPNYDSPDQIIYDNINGFAISKGIGVNIQHELSKPLTINAGFNIQDVSETEEGEKNKIEFAPQWTGVLTANYQFKRQNITVAYSSNFTGPMTLPEVFDLDANGQPLETSRPTLSDSFSIHNIQASKNFKKGFSCYTGVQNLFNYNQPWSPLVGYNDPSATAGFSDQFDTSYAYAPINGRNFYMGFRWNLN